MLTPQEIAETPLSKARFGGYDMSEVDDFLEAVTEDYTTLYKENAILKGKLKVLVEKIEEYRKTEDSMRMALHTAQKVSENIKTEADKQRESVLRDANEEIKAKLAETAKRVADEELRLSVAAKETSKFIELSQAVMKRHSEFLSKLEAATRVLHHNNPASKAAPSAPPAPPAPSAAPIHVDYPASLTAELPKVQEQHIGDVAAQIDSAMQRITGSDPVAPTPAKVVPSTAAPVARAAPPTPAPAAQIPVAPVIPTDTLSDIPSMFEQQAAPLYDAATAPTQSFEPLENLEETSPRPKFDFDDLRFGDNF